MVVPPGRAALADERRRSRCSLLDNGRHRIDRQGGYGVVAGDFYTLHGNEHDRRHAHSATRASEIRTVAAMVEERFRIGTSGWTYDDWADRFYPRGVRGSDRLQYYCGRFNAVEVNATFYRLPTEAMITAWNERMPPGFHLVLKGPRTITHHRRLKAARKDLATFFTRALRLERLEVILWQLPPSLRSDADLLSRFLDLLPKPPRHAVEFRHESWWNQRTAEILSEHGVAWVSLSHPALPADVRPTTDFLYVRFHGLGRELYRWNYTRRQLAAWVERLSPHLPGRTLYAFFNNDFAAHAPANAETFRTLISKRIGIAR